VIKYPFHKLLLYFLAISKFDRTEYASLLNGYLPSVKFDFEDPFDYIEKVTKTTPLPACVYSGDASGLRIYLNKFHLEDLHAAFNAEQFEDIIFDSDIRRKIDAMSLSSAFRKIDIIREFSMFDPQFLSVYLDCVADFSKVEQKNTYVVQCIGDPLEQKLLKKILTTTSRSHLKVVLGMKSSLDPKTIIEKSLHVSDMKADLALLNDDDPGLDRWLKLRVGIAEKLIRMGAGNKSDLDNLIEALRSEPDFEDPIIYTKEQLEDQSSDIANGNPT